MEKICSSVSKGLMIGIVKYYPEVIRKVHFKATIKHPEMNKTYKNYEEFADFVIKETNCSDLKPLVGSFCKGLLEGVIGRR